MDIIDFPFSKLFELVRNEETDFLDPDAKTDYVSDTDSDDKAGQYTPSEDYLYDEDEERLEEDLENEMSEQQIMDDMRKLLKH